MEIFTKLLALVAGFLLYFAAAVGAVFFLTKFLIRLSTGVFGLKYETGEGLHWDINVFVGTWLFISAYVIAFYLLLT